MSQIAKTYDLLKRASAPFLLQGVSWKYTVVKHVTD